MNDFIINKNKKRLNETDTIGQILKNFTGKLNIYIEDSIQESKHHKSRISVRKYKPIITNDIFSKSTASSQKKCMDIAPRMKDIDDNIPNANKSYSSINDKKIDTKEGYDEKNDNNKEVKRNSDEEENYKIKNKKKTNEKSNANEGKISKSKEEKTNKFKPKNNDGIVAKSKKCSFKKYKPLTTNVNVNENESESDSEYSIQSLSVQNRKDDVNDKEKSDDDKGEEISDSSKEIIGNKELDLITFNLNNYSLLNKIGSGSYGEVYEIKDKKTGEICAAKIFLKSLSDTNNTSKYC